MSTTLDKRKTGSVEQRPGRLRDELIASHVRWDPLADGKHSPNKSGCHYVRKVGSASALVLPSFGTGVEVGG